MGRALEHSLERVARPAGLGTLRRTAPLSHDFGDDSATPVDRHCIERFLWVPRATSAAACSKSWTARTPKELTAQALETHDHRFATVISVRAAKR